MTNALRYDFSPLKRWEKTPEGFLRVEATIARTGVQQYRRADGSVQIEYRPPEEVGDPASLASFEDKPVTLEHPPELLTDKNAREYQRGHLRNVRFDPSTGLVTAQVFVTDAEAIASIERGETREFSCGYEVEAREQGGFTPDGVRYDVLQTKIRGNHGAITRRGRAGSQVRLHLDSADAVAETACDGEDCGCGESCDCESCSGKNKKRRGKKMTTATIKINDSEFEVSEAVAAAIGSERAALKARIDSLEQSRADGGMGYGKKKDGMGYGKKKAMSEEEMMDMEEMEEEDEEDWDDEAEFMGGKKKRKAMKADSVAALQGRIDALLERVDELETELEFASSARVDSDEFQSAVDRRCAAIVAATAILGSSVKFDGMTDREILEAAFAEVSDEDVSDRSDDYLQGKLDSMIELETSRADSASPLSSALAGALGQPSGKPCLETAQAGQRDRWKQPLKASVNK